MTANYSTKITFLQFPVLESFQQIDDVIMNFVVRSRMGALTQTWPTIVLGARLVILMW